VLESPLEAVGMVCYSLPGENANEMTKKDIPDLELLEENAWLTDHIINAVQSLLAKQFQVSGLCDTLIVADWSTKLNSGHEKFVQIVHVHDPSALHWIAITNMGSRPNAVKVYCSLIKKPSDKCLQHIFYFVNCQVSELTVEIMNVGKQKGCADCGLFAVAYAEILLSGRDPTTVILYQSSISQHLKDCLLNGFLSPFPLLSHRAVRRPLVTKYVVRLYCTCRTNSYKSDNMVQCDACREWYHKSCVSLDDDTFAMLSHDKAREHRCSRCM